ncbi:MAG: hypothetical protein HWN81_11335 [Candidatus Lokiarchaeota archaeon]|nr:hypothetical protein [Candidatus Lokiarchaeota archaeon]
MNAKERILTTLDHEEPDRVPSYEASIDNLAIYNHYGIKYGYLGNGDLLKKVYDLAKGDTELLKKFIDKTNKVSDSLTPAIELYKKAGIDLCAIYVTNLPVFYEREGIIDDLGRRMHFIKNPSDDMDVLYYKGGYFKNFDDFESFPPLDPDDPVRENIFRNAKMIEDKFKGKVYTMPSIFGLFEAAWQGFGLETFSRLFTQPKIIQKIFEFKGKFLVEMVKRILEWGEENIILMGDDYGYKKGLLMNPRYYRKYVFPWIKKICQTAHNGGVKVLFHSCGDISLIFEDLINCGIDAIHPIEPTTANPEFNIFDLYQKFGDQITFVGNVSPQDLADKNPEVIRDYVKKLIKGLAPHGGFILSSGHSINPAIKLENFLMMQKTLREYGKYPINVN